MSALGDFWKGLKTGFHLFGRRIGGIVNLILLSIVYIIGVGVTALAARIGGKKFLKLQKKRGSYWERLDIKTRSIDEHYRQF